MLQWGRVLWDAERVGDAAGGSLRGGLQWGRVLWDAESRAVLGDEGRGEKASMGPRLVGRGKAMDVRPRLVIVELQWGRVLWDAERGVRPDLLAW